MENIFELEADLFKVFSNATRLEILRLLEEHEMSTTELMRSTGLSKVNISQHINILKTKGAITSRRDGASLHYRLAGPKYIQACNLMQEILAEQYDRKGQVFSDLGGKRKRLPSHRQNPAR